MLLLHDGKPTPAEYKDPASSTCPHSATMRALVNTLLFALCSLSASAQSEVDRSYEWLVVDVSSRYIQEAGEQHAFRPELSVLQVNTLHRESAEGTVMVRKLRFPLQETVCLHTEEREGKPCPIKKNGKSMLCDMAISGPVREGMAPVNTEITCETMAKADQLQQKIRMRRSKSGKGSGGNKGSGGKGSGGRGGGSRAGSGSSIAGGGSRGNGNTRTA
ncbi:hypothetical protein MATL_G00254960 [Megalops atlanticus]|uniref:Cathelicidin n=1 Tax=Megalops atlanticus TaxID=7932 RepID=A0A9D3SWA5_MEGAT|nr:hypothetical protein MATL_G00254960 [Megalops atlanticus]